MCGQLAALTMPKASQAKGTPGSRRSLARQRPRVLPRERRPLHVRPAQLRFSKMTRRAGIGRWHAHEGRHTAVSIMSSNGVPIQEISDTVRHKSTHVTETVYRT